MGPPDPPGDFLPTHSVLRVAPPPFSSAPVGFIHDNGTDFMRQYLTPLASSQPSTTPGPLVSFGGIPHGQRFIPSPGCSLNDASPIYGLGGTSCIPEGSALRAPVPHDTTSMGPRRPDPEEDISGSHLRHGVRCVSSHRPSFSSQGSSSVPSFWRQHGGPSFSSSPSPHHHEGMGGLPSPPHLLLIIMGGLQSLPIILIIIMGDLHPPPLPLGL